MVIYYHPTLVWSGKQASQSLLEDLQEGPPCGVLKQETNECHWASGVSCARHLKKVISQCQILGYRRMGCTYFEKVFWSGGTLEFPQDAVPPT